MATAAMEGAAEAREDTCITKSPCGNSLGQSKSGGTPRAPNGESIGGERETKPSALPCWDWRFEPPCRELVVAKNFGLSVEKLIDPPKTPPPGPGRK